MPEHRPPAPPFNEATAIEKVRLAEDGWNSKNPEKVSLAYTPNSKWRNRDQFINGRDEIVIFLKDKWNKELEYRLIKELFAFNGNNIAVRYAYEYKNNEGQWFRSYGNENWVFDENGLMKERYASINNVKIEESDRKLTWTTTTRPDDYPNLSQLGL